MQNLLTKLEQVAPDAQLVFVGDYVDRGPDSRQVLGHLLRMSDRAICLLGNHEVMLMAFLDDPVEKGARWLRHGGRQTLESFSIFLPVEPSLDDLTKAVEQFRTALPEGGWDWLQSRPRMWRSGNLVVSHAGMDPGRGPSDQSESDLLWGHGRFLRDPRQDGLWVAHGHWVQNKPQCRDGRVNVDTGAWKHGPLTAAIFDPDGHIRFVQSR